MAGLGRFSLTSSLLGREARWEVESERNLLRHGGDEYHVEPKVMAVLLHLVEHRGEVVSKADMLASCWPGVVVVEGVLARCISELRRILGDKARQPAFIETIPKRGYRMVARFAAGVGSAATALPTVAVLPLRNLSPERSDEYFSDGVTEMLITDLARLPTLTVISSTSSSRYKASSETLPAIAAQLGAALIVEGSVMRSGDAIRVVAQLIDAAADKHLWSDIFEGSCAQLHSFQRNAAFEIANRIGAALEGGEEAAETQAPTADLRAQDAYLRGRFFWTRREEDNGRQGMAMFQQAIDIDPEYADAHCALADCYTVRALDDAEPARELYRRARLHAERALALDSRHGGAQASLGSIQLFFEWDFEAAAGSFQAALLLSPSDAEAKLSYAELLAARGEHERAVELAVEACRLNPLDASYYSNTAVLLTFARRYEEAAEYYSCALDLADRPRLHASLAKVYALLERPDDARASLRASLASATAADDLLDLEGLVQAALGDRAAAEAILERLARRADAEQTAAHKLARIHAMLGQNDAAFAWLERACEMREPWMIFYAVNPVFDTIAKDPRHRALVERIGVPSR